tara:strand:- start:128 stop:361 length:234 start_codon:yes stop_codon:yes gene_type:complete
MMKHGLKLSKEVEMITEDLAIAGDKLALLKEVVGLVEKINITRLEGRLPATDDTERQREILGILGVTPVVTLRRRTK